MDFYAYNPSVTADAAPPPLTQGGFGPVQIQRKMHFFDTL